MALGTWTRSTFRDNAFTFNYHRVANVPQGQTLRRVRFGWGASVIMDTRESALNMQQLSVGFGLWTCTSSTPTADIPDPTVTGVDTSPPLSRFIWWEQRQMECHAWDSAGHVSAWSTSQAQEVADSHAQVLANTTGTDDLYCYAVFGVQPTILFTGEGNIWLWASVLYE